MAVDVLRRDRDRRARRAVPDRRQGRALDGGRRDRRRRDRRAGRGDAAAGADRRARPPRVEPGKIIGAPAPQAQAQARPGLLGALDGDADAAAAAVRARRDRADAADRLARAVAEGGHGGGRDVPGGLRDPRGLRARGAELGGPGALGPVQVLADFGRGRSTRPRWQRTREPSRRCPACEAVADPVLSQRRHARRWSWSRPTQRPRARPRSRSSHRAARRPPAPAGASCTSAAPTGAEPGRHGRHLRLAVEGRAVRGRAELPRAAAACCAASCCR